MAFGRFHCMSVVQAFFVRFQKNSRQKKTQGIFTENSTYWRYFTKKSSKNFNFISFCDPKLLGKSQIWENFLKKHDFHTKTEDNFRGNNWKLAKAHETQGILEKNSRNS